MTHLFHIAAGQEIMEILDSIFTIRFKARQVRFISTTLPRYWLSAVECEIIHGNMECVLESINLITCCTDDIKSQSYIILVIIP